MINLNDLTWQEFLLRTLTLHWLTATIVVLCVSLMIAALTRINATTRHNVWLLTLISLALMPLLIFAPRPDVNVPDFSFSTTVESARESQPNLGAPAELSRERAQRTASELEAFDDGASVSAEGLTQPVGPPIDVAAYGPAASDVQISLLSVVKAIFVFWLVGVVFLLRRLWGEYRAARELELQSDSVTPYFDRRFDQLCARLGIDERPLLRFHAGINAPMTVGLMRVWVAIPMTWRETIDDSVFDQTLTHELGHIARKDPAIHTLQRLLSIVFWMYPAVWYVSRQLEVERESACDDWVLTHDGKSASYATNLLDVAESLYLQPQVLAVGCLRSHSQLSRRIQNLLNKSSDHKVSNSRTMLALTSVVLMATLSVSAVVWPDARQLAPPAEQLAQTPLSEPESIRSEVDSQAPLADLPVTSGTISANDISRFQIKPQAPKAAAAPQPLPKPVPVVDKASRKSVTVYERDNGKLTIERHRSGKIEVSVKPKIKSQDPLLLAAWKGDKKTVKKLIAQGKDLNQIYTRPVSPYTALEAAILNGHESTVEAMIDLGVDLSPDTPAGFSSEIKSPLTIAAMASRYSIARRLLMSGVKPDDDTLDYVARNKDPRLLELFLKRTECDCLDTAQAVLIAIQNHDSRSLDVLVRYDAEIDRGALVTAVKENNTKIVEKLLKNYNDDVDDATLTIAIQNRNSSIVEDLIKAGAKPSAGALTLAVQQRDVQLVDKLLELGATAEEGALVLAIEQRNAQMADVLMKAGAPVNDGALVMAVQQRDVGTVRSLLKHDVEVQEGPLVIAIQNQDLGLIRMLLDAGAEVADGALIVAAQTGNADIIRLVRKRSGLSEEELQSGVLRSFEGSEEFGKNYQASVEARSAAYTAAHQGSHNTNENINRNKNKNKNKNQSRNTSNFDSTFEHDFAISRWPVESSRISLGFDDTSAKYGSHTEMHKALDFPIKEGSPVYAVAEGYVKESGYSGGYGNYVVIDHGNGYKTKYANNKINKVSKGDYVKAYQKIALVGNTAQDSTDPHLHFELRKNGHNIDPQLVFSSSQN